MNFESDNKSELRIKAEQLFKDQQRDSSLTENKNNQQLIHELELQNEELRNAQIELEEIKRNYFELYDIAPCGYLKLNKNGLITEANLTSSKIMGVNKAQLINRGLSRFITAKFQDEFYKIRLKCLESKKKQSCELKLKKGKGEIWAHLDIKTLTDSEGVVNSYLLTIIDITERKNKEISFLQKTSELDQIFNTSPDWMRIIDLDYNVLSVNDSMADITGMEKNEAIGKKCYEIFTGTQCNTDDCPVKRMIVEGKRFVTNVEKQCCEDKIVPCILTVTPFIGIDGQIIGIVESFKDITILKNTEKELREERDFLEGLVITAQEVVDHQKKTEEELKKSEERFRMICEYAPVMMDAFDENGRYILWNKKCEETFGWSIEEINSSDEPLALFFPEAAIRDLVIETVTSKPEKVFREWNPHTKEGAVLTCMRASFRLLDGIVMNLGYDITERINSEKEKMILQNKLFHSEKMASIGEVASGLGHEINQPLGALLFTSEILETAVKKKDLKRIEMCAGKVKSQVERISRLCSSLNIFSRNSDQDKFEPVDLNESIEIIATLLAPQNKQDGIELDLKLSDDSPLIIASRIDIERVVLNILNNARFAVNSNMGEKEITVQTCNEDDTKTIIISDNGSGIPKDKIKKIFDPFFTTKEIGQGTGLGLSMCYGIVEKYSGTISVESTVDKGTVFTIVFPVCTNKGCKR